MHPWQTTLKENIIGKMWTLRDYYIEKYNLNLPLLSDIAAQKMTDGSQNRERIII